MLVTHKIKWQQCLSHQIWPYIEKGWKDEDRNIHFFWGLAGSNIAEINECDRLGEEWWYVDVGYITDQITRYPNPIIHKPDSTYFRIIKGHIHTQIMKPGNGDRLKQLNDKGVDTIVEDWQNNDGHILLCPSSPTVTFRQNNMSQEDWIKHTGNTLLQYTDRPIRMRNKPRPGNEWWGTDIKDELKGAHALVTNMSLSAIDAIKMGIPTFTDTDNIASPVSNTYLGYIETPMKPNREIVNEWLNCIVENQFTLDEIGSGIAYEILKRQNEDTIL